MTRMDDMLRDEQLKAAVNASAASVPEDFIWNTERMIDHLPRKERYIVRNKLSVGLVLTIILCLLAATAVAAVLLTGRELVEQEVLPMALENDARHDVPLMFTNEELQQIAALAEKNGITLSEGTMLALKNGLTVPEKDIILDIVYEDLGPDPMRWSLEEQHWFYEAMVQLGVMKVNDHLLPGEGDLTEAEAFAKALEYVTAQPADSKGYLRDPAFYDILRSFKRAYHQDGTPAGTVWHFGFMQKNGPIYYEVIMDAKGNRIAVMMHDTSEYANVTEKFSNAELASIVALAEENGITLSSDILRALEKGEGYWEEEVIMSLAKSQFGPIPGQWTIEEQYWFEETVVDIGFKDYNQCRIPGEGELTYEEAYAKALELFVREGWLTDPAILADRSKYDLWRSYLAVHNEEGTIADPVWNLRFEACDVNLPTLSVEVSSTGEILNQGFMPGLEDRLAAGTVRYYEVQDAFQLAYGSMPTWLPETYVTYVDALGRSDLTGSGRGAQAYLNTHYILPPEGALTREQAIDIAVQQVGGEDIRVGAVICFLQDSRAMWKVCIASDSNRISDMVELDCITGEIIQQYKTDADGHAVQFYVPKQVYDEFCALADAEGNG